MKKLLAALKSMKLTAWLIVALAVLSLVGITVPQKSLLGREAYLAWQHDHPLLVGGLEALKLTQLHSSPLMITLWVLFFANLLLVMADRVPGIWRLCREVRLPRDSGFVKSFRCSGKIENVSADEACRALSERGYHVIREGSAFAAIRNRYAPMGTLLFHLSFLLLLAGGVMTVYTRFRAEADIAAGETFEGSYSRIHTRPKIGPVPTSRFTVLSIKPSYYKHTVPVDLAVELATREGRKAIGINRPYYDGKLSFLIKNVDVAPLFLLKDASGKEVDGAFVKLKILGGEEDGFSLQNYTFHIRFHTDIVAERKSTVAPSANLPQALKQQPNEGGSSQVKEVVNPAVTVTVEKGGKKLQTATIRPHESVYLDNGLRLEWDDFTYWINFYVGQEQGLNVVYAAFTLMTIALVIRFGFYRRDIRGYAEEGTVWLAGRTEYFPVMFADEFATLLASLEMKRSP